jgi:hypothetical protein
MADLSHITRFGLPGIGRVAFGVHACLFYSDPDQFVAALVPLLEGFLKEARIVTEAWRTSPMVVELVRRVQEAQAFLRMAAIELRRIAEQPRI